MMHLGIFGAGRLAAAIADEARAEGHTVAWSLHRLEEPSTTDIDVAIDASAAEAVEGHVRWAVNAGVPLVIGTTGWVIPDLATIVGTRTGVLTSSNFSFAVALMRRFAEELTRFADWYGEGDLAIFEHHHKAKRDAPSGTALSMAQAIVRASQRYHTWSAAEYRHDALPVASLRAGAETGYHALYFDAPHEKLAITHQARDRKLFAAGALKAAAWLQGKKGVYTMDDLVASVLAEAEHGNLQSGG
ncbi:MAG: 4-hydroxy-tetrahydrodipicolinate reductase [Spirochaetaceae bacterium]|nr:4-hydroxy-tetrahydrodipicolinate reductase [Spirochaetaceae bacterium]